MCRGTPAAGPGGEPISNRRAALIQANLIQRDGAEHHVLVVRSDQREVQLVATQAGLFLLSEVVARISLGVGLVRHENRCITGSLNARTMPGTSASRQGRSSTTSPARGGTGNQSSAMSR